jgi:large subunit ribosomal protein L10
LDRETKMTLVESMREALSASPSVVLVDFNGMDVETAGTLRRKCEEAGVGFKVIKNRLIAKAVEGTEHDVIAPLLRGMTAIAWANDDPVGPAKIIAEFAEKHEGMLALKGGALQGDLLDVAGMTALSKMPGLDELRSTLLGLFNTPAQKLLAQVNAPAQNVVGVVKAWCDEQEGEAA